MKIAQVAPLYESVPPKYYGGTERVVSYLTEELVRQGNEVTLFASGDSDTDARLIPVAHRSLRLDKHCIDEMAHHVLLLERVHQRASEFDMVHFHLGYLHFPMARQLTVPHVSTQHGRLDIADLQGLYVQFRDLPNVSISNDQRAPMPWMNWVATVLHGLSEDQYAFHPPPGRTSPFWGGSHRKSASTVPSRSRRGSGCRSRSPPRWTRSTPTTSRPRSAPCCATISSSTSARSVKARRQSFSGAPSPCCSRSTGPS